MVGERGTGDARAAAAEGTHHGAQAALPAEVSNVHFRAPEFPQGHQLRQGLLERERVIAGGNRLAVDLGGHFRELIL
jgi:hypothetical protein